LLLSSARAGRSTGMKSSTTLFSAIVNIFNKKHNTNFDFDAVQRVDVGQFNLPEGTDSLAIYHLPDEIIMYTFSFLTHVDLINCYQVRILMARTGSDLTC
jgi:hypothetical protein